jgi:hypothetical protein
VSSEAHEQCVILKPFPLDSWKQISAVTVVGFYAMPGLSEDLRGDYIRRVNESARTLLTLVAKDVSADAMLVWDTQERTMAEIIDLGAVADRESTWAVIVGLGVEFRNGEPDADIAQSFGDAWIPRYGSLMQFHVPFTDAPNVAILDGDPDFALLLQR